MGFDPITFTRLPDLMIATETSDEDIWEKLVEKRRLATREYGKIKTSCRGVVGCFSENVGESLKALLNPPAQNDSFEKKGTTLQIRYVALPVHMAELSKATTVLS
jgi:hypothetical protein